MSPRHAFVAAALAALSLAACGEASSTASGSSTPATSAAPSAKQAAKPPASASAATPAQPSTATAGADPYAGLVPADYEDEAEQAITPESLDAELAKIEAELHAK